MPSSTRAAGASSSREIRAPPSRTSGAARWNTASAPAIAGSPGPLSDRQQRYVAYLRALDPLGTGLHDFVRGSWLPATARHAPSPYTPLSPAAVMPTQDLVLLRRTLPIIPFPFSFSFSFSRPYIFFLR